jgi:hypothetical protein
LPCGAPTPSPRHSARAHRLLPRRAVPAAARLAAQGDGGTLLAEARQLLAGTQKIRRPRKRKGLIAVLHSHFSKKVPESEVRDLVDKLIARGELSESNGAITYHF